MLTVKSSDVKIVIDNDLYMCLDSCDTVSQDIIRSFNRDIYRMCSTVNPRIETLEEAIMKFTTYVAVLSNIKAREYSSSGKLIKPIMLRIIQKNCGDWCDTSVSMMEKSENDVPTGYLSKYLKLKEEMREYVFDHIPEMVEIVFARINH